MRKTILICLLLVMSAFLSAQSVNSVAGKTRKKDGDKPVKVYTNQDLNSTKGNVATNTLPPSGTADTKAEPPQKPQEQVNQEYQQKILEQAKKINELTVSVEYWNNEIARRRTEYMSASSGPYANSVLKPRWDEALKKWEDTKKELEQARKDLTALDDEARKAGVPAADRDLSRIKSPEQPEAPITAGER